MTRTNKDVTPFTRGLQSSWLCRNQMSSGEWKDRTGSCLTETDFHFHQKKRSLETVVATAAHGCVSLLPVAGTKDPDKGSLRKGYWDHISKAASIMAGGHGGRSVTWLVLSHLQSGSRERCSAHFLRFTHPRIPSSGAAHFQDGSPYTS